MASECYYVRCTAAGKIHDSTSTLVAYLVEHTRTLSDAISGTETHFMLCTVRRNMNTDIRIIEHKHINNINATNEKHRGLYGQTVAVAWTMFMLFGRLLSVCLMVMRHVCRYESTERVFVGCSSTSSPLSANVKSHEKLAIAIVTRRQTADGENGRGHAERWRLRCAAAFWRS